MVRIETKTRLKGQPFLSFRAYAQNLSIVDYRALNRRNYYFNITTFHFTTKLLYIALIGVADLKIRSAIS